MAMKSTNNLQQDVCKLQHGKKMENAFSSRQM